MSYSVIPTPLFKTQVKRLTKKFPSLKPELAELEHTLAEHPILGTRLGNNTYKIRLAIKSKGKGKSGGGRIITYILNEQKEIFLLTIYDKSEIENVGDKTLQKLIADIPKM